MTTVGTSLSIHARSFVKRRVRVELPNACNELNNGLRNEAEPPKVNRRADGELVACQSETRTFPELVENRVSSTFTAQILGQGSPTRPMDAASGARAYARARRDAPPPQLLRLA